MKKSYKLILSIILVVPVFTGFSQSLILKSELPASRFEVEAAIMDNDTWCRVEWPGVYNYDEFSYDDGEADDYFIFSNPGGINVNKFTPWSNPAEITGGKINVGNGLFPGPFIGTQFRAMIFDDDGSNGLPGTVLDSMDVTVENYYWVEFDGLSAVINSGSFYLGMKQLAASPDAAPIGVDTDNPTYFKSYSFFNNNWVTSPLQDFMIRAWVSNGNTNGNIDFYQVDRFSGFDPNGSPLLGDTTFLDNVTNPHYNDFGWAALPMGWYAYGVKEHYVGGGWSDYNLSNLAGHLTSYTIPINITLCDTTCWESTVVIVNGEEVFAELTPDGAYVTLEFNSPSPGYIDIEVYSPGNDTYLLNNVFISQDDVINIALMCTKYPARNLSVDPVTMIATWEPPQVVRMEQNFEGVAFPPPGWQMQSLGNGWFRTEDGGGGGWSVPAWNSNYACANDLLSGGNDGSMDYLISPQNQLDYRSDFRLKFDSYFNGFSGQSAFIEYSIDGEDWDIFYEIESESEWESILIDLSPFSGPDGPPQVWFAFHADDNGQDASGWAVDNIEIYSPDPPYTLDGYWVYIDDSLFAITDTNFIDLSPLTYGENYTIKVKAHFPSGLSIPVTDTVFCLYLYPPSCFYQENNLLLVACPPLDTNGTIPPNLLGINLYRDMEFLEYISFVPEPPPFPIEIDISDLGPGIYTFGLTAVYDLTPYGFPGETGESLSLTTEVIVSYGHHLPFLEPWNSGTFGTNNWLPGAENWSLTGQEGNPAPSAQFTWDPIQNDYQIALESYPLLADSLTEGHIYLDFDLKLYNVNTTGTEEMLVQVWNWNSQEWSTVSSYSNDDGSFDWMSEHLDITDLAMHQIFKIRFAASGDNSINILSWLIDNIHVYRECNPPLNLSSEWLISNTIIYLTWENPSGIGFEDQWIHWDDGMNTGNAIGGPLVFDVAARWEPAQLVQFEGGTLTEIAFLPAEVTGTYHVRVWVGNSDPLMIIDQLVENPLIGQWNYIMLNTPHQIDITQELWVGYHINCQTGYPAGVDDGPAIDGYGNMLKFGDWSSLLEINPELDYNWNIAAFIHQDSIITNLTRYAIYRSDDSEPFFLRDFSDQNYYLDDSICYEVPAFLFEYKVTAIYVSANDTCESGYSNVVTEICSGINDDNQGPYLNIYPNPASDLLFIESEEKIVSVSIIDSKGIKQLNNRTIEQLNNETVKIPVGGLAPGLYLVRVVTGSGVFGRKVVVR